MAIGATANPARDARELLESYWPTASNGLPVLPVDPYTLADSLGISVFNKRLDPGTAGILVKRGGQDPEIYLNPEDAEVRQRFTCAHEIGHFVTHVGGPGDEWEYLDRRDARSSTGTRGQEIYANRFAAALLMPAHAVRALATKHDIFELAAKFDVSLEAMRFRLKNLNIVESV